ncbi:MAG: putative metalloprotease CJM1_0395 family protein [Pseudomonadota bacterium]
MISALNTSVTIIQSVDQPRRSTTNDPANEASEENAEQPQTENTANIEALTSRPDVQNSVLNTTELTPEEERIVEELKRVDREVRAHEQAHKTVGGPIAGAITYQFTTGPDGKQYAVSGEVDIDISPESDPEDTIRKMDIVIRAALAPAQPSAQDRSVAAQARQIQQAARRDLQEQRQAEQNEQNNVNTSPLEQLQEAALNPDTEETQATQPEITRAIENLIQANNLSSRNTGTTISESA